MFRECACPKRGENDFKSIKYMVLLLKKIITLTDALEDPKFFTA